MKKPTDRFIVKLEVSDLFYMKRTSKTFKASKEEIKLIYDELKDLILILFE